MYKQVLHNRSRIHNHVPNINLISQHISYLSELNFRMSEPGCPNLAQHVGGPAEVVKCKKCGEQCTWGFSKGDEAKDTQNLLVHEIMAHNWTMPELAHGFRAKGAESKELLDTAIKQAPTHQKACNLVILQAFHMHHLKGIQCPHLDFFGQSCPDLVRILLKSPDFS